jgi:hypothetical protein
MATRWRIIRTSNAYVFRDPLPCAENRPKTEAFSACAAEWNRKAA